MPIPQGSADTVEDMNAENYEYYDEGISLSMHVTQYDLLLHTITTTL